jgi:hypothetical protein
MYINIRDNNTSSKRRASCMEQEQAMRSFHCVDLHYHPVFSFVFTLRYFASSDGDSFRSIPFILVFSFILWRNSQNPMRDDDCINITCYILIIHIIFQRSLTRGTKTGIKTETQSFLVWYYGNNRIYIQLENVVRHCNRLSVFLWIWCYL